MKFLNKLLLFSCFLLILPLNVSVLRVSSQTEIAPNIDGVDIVEINTPNELFTLNWTVTDNDAKSYEIVLDEEVVGRGDWIQRTGNDTLTAVTHIVKLDLLLDVGDYIITLTVTDYSDLSSSFITTVLIRKAKPPDAFLPINMYSFILPLIIITIIKRRKN